DAGIVEEAVDPAEFVDRRLHIGLYVRGPRDIGCHRNGLPASLPDDAGGGFGARRVAVHHDHLRTVAGECRGCRTADAVASARDQRNFAGEIHLTTPPPERATSLPS